MCQYKIKMKCCPNYHNLGNIKFYSKIDKKAKQAKSIFEFN